MPREIKTKSEIEVSILARLQAWPGGENITGVAIYPGDIGSNNPTVSVLWVDSPNDMTAIIDKAHELAAEFCSDYEVKADDARSGSAHRTTAP